MSLESFYGGKQGISPVIKNSFLYITAKVSNGVYVDPGYGAAITKAELIENEEDREAKIAEIKNNTMDECFADNNYSDVWYNELCIIDSRNKNNPNNGKLYRRTLKGRGDSDLENMTAEYIGRITGPAGGNPFMAFNSIDFVQDKAIENYTVNEDTVISWPDGLGSTTTRKPTERNSLYVYDASLSNGMLVSGAEQDTIKYTWFNIIDNTTPGEENEYNNNSMVYLGFQIPYPALNIGIESLNWDEDIKIKKQENSEHPFKHDWTLSVPRGIRGNAASNIRIAKVSDFSNLSVNGNNKPYLYDFFESVQEDSGYRGSFNIIEKTPDELVWDTDDEKNRYANMSLFVYDYIFYDVKKDGTVIPPNSDYQDGRWKKYTFYLGKVDEIKDVDIDSHGTITFTYSDPDKTQTFNQAIKWINGINVNTTNGKITIIYNQLGADNTPVQDTWTLPLPKTFSVNDTPSADELGIGNGNVSIGFTDGTFINLKDTEGQIFHLNYVDSINMDENSKVLKYTVWPSEIETELNDGEGINYIKAMVVGDDYHLYAYYASDQFRPLHDDVTAWMEADPKPENSPISEVQVEPNGKFNVIWKGQNFKNGIIDAATGITANDYWQNFGPIRNIQQGIRITTKFDLTDYPGADAVSSYTKETFLREVLNAENWGRDEDQEIIPNPYADGHIKGQTALNGEELKGAICYSPEVEGGSAYFYDYAANEWSYLGRWNDTTARTDAGIRIVTATSPYWQILGDVDLSDPAIICVEKNNHNVTNPLPTLWSNN